MPTVEEELKQQLPDGEINSIQVYNRYDGKVDGLVVMLTEGSEIKANAGPGMRIVLIRHWRFDTRDDQLTVDDSSDNSIWLPADFGDNVDALADALQRSVADQKQIAAGNTDTRSPYRVSSTDDVDLDLLLARETDPTRRSQDKDRMMREPGIDPTRDWGYYGGAPPEIEMVVERLENAELATERFIPLEFGQKKPHGSSRPVGDLDHPQVRGADKLGGNYGIIPAQQDDGLVIIDVDYPSEMPSDVDLPVTFATSSPHGSDDRKHLFYRCRDKQTVRDHIGSWKHQGLSFGEMYLGDQHVVGPGSQLSAYGCDNGDHNRGDGESCERCADPDSGYYRIVDDNEIAEISSDTLIELVEASTGNDEDESDGGDREVEQTDAVKAKEQSMQEAIEELQNDGGDDDQVINL